MSVMENQFQDKRALVTGAGQGIGRAITIELSKRGASVIALSRSKNHLDTLKTEIPDVEIVCLDISNWEKTKNAVENMGRIDLLVNNAGISILEPVGDISEDAFDKSFAVNVKAVINISQIVAKKMKANGLKGAIVNISSQGATAALENHTIYCATKAALDQVTKVMALELGPHQIRVNSVNPTIVLTTMGKMAWGDPSVAAVMTAKIPLRKFCEPDDVVQAVLFLLSDQAAMITGAQLPIDGGYTIH